MPASSSSPAPQSEQWTFHEDCRLLSIVSNPRLLSGLSQLNEGFKSRAHLDVKTYRLSPFDDKTEEHEAGIFNAAFNDKSQGYFLGIVNGTLYPALAAVAKELDMNRTFPHCNQNTLESRY